jgi:hypothetical protein
MQLTRSTSAQSEQAFEPCLRLCSNSMRSTDGLIRPLERAIKGCEATQVVRFCQRDAGKSCLARRGIFGPGAAVAGASSRGLDRLFDEGWLTEAGANRARFAEPTRLQEIAVAISWSRKRKWHSDLARACEALRQPPGNLRITILRHDSLKLPGPCSFAPPKRHVGNVDFGRRWSSSVKHLTSGPLKLSRMRDFASCRKWRAAP